jgi:methanogenic corrinoid protein MtbC1
MSINDKLFDAIVFGERDDVVEHFNNRDEVKVVIGGAVISQEFADQIGADGFGFDASDAVRESLGLSGVAA